MGHPRFVVVLDPYFKQILGAPGPDFGTWDSTNFEPALVSFANLQIRVF